MIVLLYFVKQPFIVCSNSNEIHHNKLHNVFSISLYLVVFFLVVLYIYNI